MGYPYAEKVFVVYLKFKLNWVFRIFIYKNLSILIAKKMHKLF